MYEPRHLQYIELPLIPEDIVQNYLTKLDSVEAKWTAPDASGYMWSDSNNQEIHEWCTRNICADMYWGFQHMPANVPVHNDVGTVLKFVYLIQPGGENVITRFYPKNKPQEDYHIPVHKWHILKVDCDHSVDGIQLNQRRISVTGRLF